MKKYYEILQLDPESTRNQVNERYASLIKEFDPKNNEGMEDFFEKEIENVKDAYIKIIRHLDILDKEKEVEILKAKKIEEAKKAEQVKEAVKEKENNEKINSDISSEKSDNSSSLNEDNSNTTYTNTSNWDLYGQAWQTLNGYRGLSIGFLILYFIISALSNFIPVVGVILVAPSFTVGFWLFFLNVSRSKEASIDDLFKGFNSFWAAVGTNLLILLCMIVPFMIFSPFLYPMGFLSPASMGLLPILILVFFMYIIVKVSIAFLVIADNPNCGGSEAFGYSWKMTTGFEWKIIGFSFFAMIIVFLSIFTFGIALLWTIPWVSVAFVKLYDEIKRS